MARATDGTVLLALVSGTEVALIRTRNGRSETEIIDPAESIRLGQQMISAGETAPSRRDGA